MGRYEYRISLITAVFAFQVPSPSPDRNLLQNHVGPIDYTKQETIKQEAIKQEASELTIANYASGIKPLLFVNILFDFFHSRPVLYLNVFRETVSEQAHLQLCVPH